MTRLLATLAILLVWAPLLRAEALDRRQVPAGAAWFIHLDADAARESILGRRLHELWLSRPQIAKAIDEAQNTFGIDPTRDIRSITVYGTTFTPDAGVVIARGKVDHTRIEGLLKSLPGYHSDTIDGHAVYFWTESAPNRRHDSAGAFFGDDTIVIAPDGPAVTAALAVLDGKAAGLSSDSALSADAVPGAILQASAAGLAQAKALPIQSPIVRQCESGSLAVGEQAGDVFLQSRIVTASPETATRLCQLLIGVKAMAEFQTPDKPELANLLQSLKVTASDKTVEIQWQYSSIELVKIIQTEQARQSATTQPGLDP
jgi:hypothetical protein